LRILPIVFAWLAAAFCMSAPAAALKSIVISPDQERIEITALGDLYEGRGDSLQVETAADGQAAGGRMSVRATTPGTNPSWIVFALTNPTDQPIERWLSADRYTLIGSGAVWPDLDARRIEAVTPSIGFMPERIESQRADVFRITIEPGQTITYVAELSSERYARIYLWKPIDYELKVRERQLFNGVMLGLTGLLAIFLTAIFAANHKIIFPAAALVAWCVLGYLCVDFGFFHKLFQLKAENNAVYRAATESAMAASLVIFLYFFLRIPLWHGMARMLFGVWIVSQLALVGLAVIDPRLASTFARLSFAAIGVVGMLVIAFLALRGQDRALSLIPTWMLLLVWVFATAVTLTGQLSGDVVVSGLVAGLVLIVLLIGFTVTQFAFRSLEPIYGTSPNELQLRSVAVDAAGAGLWEWSARRDEMKVGSNVELALGLNAGELNTKTDDFCQYIHPADRERFKLALQSAQERNDGRLMTSFRLRHADNSYRWYDLEASTVPSSDGRTIKSIGLLRDVSDSRRAQERLLHDAVRCSLTGLPNRQLLLDRLEMAILRAKTEPAVRPTLLLVDIDKFKSVNATYGVVVGDSLILTVARRLQRHIEADDTLARVGGDRFAIMLTKERSAAEVAGLAERVRRSLRSAIQLIGHEIVLTGSLGVALYDGEQRTADDLLREAETAMFRAKRAGSDNIEIFRPEMRAEPDEREELKNAIAQAIETKQLRLFYQPIVFMPMEELAGFQAVVRWEHPRHGLVNPFALLEPERSADVAAQILKVVLARILRDCAIWQKELPRTEKQLFVNLELPRCVAITQELSQDVRQALSRQTVGKGSLKLGVLESVVMENPEQAAEQLEWLRGAGSELVLADFGTGYGSIPYLSRLPFEAYRIDRTMLDGVGTSEIPGRGLLKAMTALVHELGRKIIVDGVESDEDVSFLRSIDCEYGQGLYYGEPLAQRDVLHLLKLVRKSERKSQPRGLYLAASRKRRTDAPAETTSQAGPQQPPPLPAPVGMPSASPEPEAPSAAIPPLPGVAVPPAPSRAAGNGASPADDAARPRTKPHKLPVRHVVPPLRQTPRGAPPDVPPTPLPATPVPPPLAAAEGPSGLAPNMAAFVSAPFASIFDGGARDSSDVVTGNLHPLEAPPISPGGSNPGLQGDWATALADDNSAGTARGYPVPKGGSLPGTPSPGDDGRPVSHEALFVPSEQLAFSKTAHSEHPAAAAPVGAPSDSHRGSYQPRPIVEPPPLSVLRPTAATAGARDHGNGAAVEAAQQAPGSSPPPRDDALAARYEKLPPNIVASLQRLAGGTRPRPSIPPIRPTAKHGNGHGGNG
jgi:diguanylate cyclase (GGDEF)-like protein